MAFPPDLGYELVNPPIVQGNGFKFGRGTRVHVAQATFGAPAMRTDDQPNARADGISFGRDYLGGRNLTFDINIKTRTRTELPDAHTLYSNMEQAWLTEDTYVGASRLTPGEVSELYMTRHGQATRIAYGRPRQIEPTTGRVDSGWIPVTASFQTITHKFYDAAWQQNSLSSAPSSDGKFDLPFIFPLNTLGITASADIVVVGGNTETWMLSKIWGPISGPKITVVDYYTIETTSDFSLMAGEYLELDPRPWARKILKNGVTNVAGKFTQASRRIGMQTLPPGTHQVYLSGIDPTGTARLDTLWRNAWTTW